MTTRPVLSPPVAYQWAGFAFDRLTRSSQGWYLAPLARRAAWKVASSATRAKSSRRS